MIAVILAGGRGERFWPRSRQRLPKQFLAISGAETMLQATVRRVARLVPPERILLVTAREFGELAREQAPELPAENFLLEPCGRDTAAAIGWAALEAERRDPESVMAVLPADHVIGDADAFLDVLQAAHLLAGRRECLVTIGVRPTRPEAGFGYIRRSADYVEVGRHRAHRVLRFVEKPDCATAEAFVRSGEYLWNSGVFVWKPAVIRGAIEASLPEVHHALQRIRAALGAPGEAGVVAAEYARLPQVSIDYGVMERAEQVYVIPGEFGWHDAGSWNALADILPRDENGNVARGETLLVDARGCVVDGGRRLVAGLGLENLVIVDADDVLFICPRHRARELKDFIPALRARYGERYL